MSSISYLGGKTGIFDAVELPAPPDAAGSNSADILAFLGDLVEALADSPLFDAPAESSGA